MHALHTDLYQLTMAAGYFHRGMADAVATCELFVRRLPRARHYLVAMGLERALDYIEGLRFTDAQIEYLATVPSLRDAMTPAFAEYLRDFRFRGGVWAMPEGTMVFAGEPILRVRAPIIEAQILETFVLSAVNHATMIASKAARIVQTAGDAGVMEFGSRRTHPEAAVDAARAACAVGCVGTSNVEAGMRYGLPVLGTAAHMWTMAHDSEDAAFEAYVAVFPNAAILLIDTYDTLRGAARAAKIAREKLKGVRLDSGDLLALSRAVRVILDETGCGSARIVVSGDLNEYKIAELRRAGAPIDLYGVGTELVASVDAPALGGVYKLVELERDGRVVPIAKFSEGKATLPGPHQVHRILGEDGRMVRDVIVLEDEPLPANARELLVPVMDRGARVRPAEPLAAIKARVSGELAELPPHLHALEQGGAPYPVAPSPRLAALVEAVRAEVAAPRPGDQSAETC